MSENEIAAVVMDVSFDIHRRLGPGMLETVYEVILAKKLEQRGFLVMRQVPIAMEFDQIKFEEGFRADLIVNNLVLIEVKSVEHLSPAAFRQVVTYLRFTNLRLGLLINFGESYLKDGIRRMVNGLDDSHA